MNPITPAIIAIMPYFVVGETPNNSLCCDTYSRSCVRLACLSSWRCCCIANLCALASACSLRRFTLASLLRRSSVVLGVNFELVLVSPLGEDDLGVTGLLRAGEGEGLRLGDGLLTPEPQWTICLELLICNNIIFFLWLLW